MSPDETPSDLARPCSFHAGSPAGTCEQCAEELEEYFEYLDAEDERRSA